MFANAFDADEDNLDDYSDTRDKLFNYLMQRQ